MQPNIQNKKTSLPGWALNAGGLALSLIVIAASLYSLWPRLAGLFPQACAPRTLTLGERRYEIKTIKMQGDGSFQVPANQPGTAYWVQGTRTHPVIALSLTAENLALLNSLKEGDAATVAAGGDCGGSIYAISPVQKGVPDSAAVEDQAASGITLFVQTYGSAGFTAAGTMKEAIANTGGAAEPADPQEPQMTTVPTPDYSKVQAEISLLGLSASPDGQTVTITVSILNTGIKAARLAKRDVSLKEAEGKSLRLEGAEPSLPQDIKPGETREFSLIFARPAAPTATIKVLGVEYDIEGY